MQEVHTQPLTMNGLACWRPVFKAIREIRQTGDSSGLDAGLVRAEQMSAITRLTPWMMFVNLANALFIITSSWNELSAWVAFVWSMALTLLCAMTLVSWSRNRHRPTQRRLSKKVIDRAIVNATALGLLWGVVPSILFNTSPVGEQLIIVTILGGMMAGGAFALYVIPAAAFAYIASVSLPFIILLLIGNNNNLEHLAIVATLFATTMALTVSHAYQRFLTQLKNRADLREQSQIIALLLKDFEDASRDWMWETDEKFELTYVSEGLAERLEVNADDLLGQKISHLKQIDFREGWSELVKHRDNRTGFKDLVCSGDINGERFWWALTARPIFDIDDNFTGYRGVGTDVTTRVRDTEALRSAKEEAEEANEAKSRFLAMISHELRTPLNAIIGFSDLIKSECHGEIADKRYVDFAEDINDGGRHLLTIINDLLDLARIDSQQFKMEASTFDLDEIIDSVSRMTRIGAEDKKIDLAISSDFDPELSMRGDFARVRQILINLVFNAIKFTPEGGSVSLDTRVRDGAVRFTVKDTGPGIPENMEEALFEPFRQGENTHTRKSEGVGLGLPIARKLAEAHGGTVTLTNRTDAETGAIAELVLPLPSEECEDQRWQEIEQSLFADAQARDTDEDISEPADAEEAATAPSKEEAA